MQSKEEPVQMKCADCEAKEKAGAVQAKCDSCEEKSAVQTKKTTDSSGTGISAQLAASKGGGIPMPAKTGDEMSSSFGTDFKDVRIHTGSNAVEMNKNLGSHAFTNGKDIYFNQGKYAPGNKEGKRLLAHELTHTIQQGAVSDVVQQNTVTKQFSLNGKHKSSRFRRNYSNELINRSIYSSALHQTSASY